MANAAGSQLRTCYQVETAYATVPTVPALIKIPVKKNTLDLSTSQLVDDSLRDDRMGGDASAGMRKIGGELEWNHRYGTYDDFLANMLRGTWTNNVLKGGKVVQSMLVEDGHTDIGQYRHFLGLRGASMKISITPDSHVPVSMTFMGKTVSDFSGTSLVASATEVEHKPFTSFIGSIEEGGGPIAIVTSLEMEINNGTEESVVVFQNEISGTTDGNLLVTSKMTLKFIDDVMYAKFKGRTESSLEFTLTDDDGNSQIWSIPKIVYTGASISKDSPGELSLVLDVNAQYDSVSGTKIFVTRVAA